MKTIMKHDKKTGKLVTKYIAKCKNNEIDNRWIGFYAKDDRDAKIWIENHLDMSGEWEFAREYPA